MIVCGSDCRSLFSTTPAAPRRSAPTWPPWPGRRTTPALTTSPSWTISSRSPSSGRPEHDMLEAYTTLGYLAACTSRAQLLTLVTGVVYRNPGVLAKIVTTLDVLSGGRAWLGIGAALERGGVARPGHPVPARRRAVRAAGGGAADLPADVARRRVALPRQALPAGAAAEPPAAAVPAAPADHDRRRRRAQDAAARGPLRPGLQPVPRPGPGPQAGRAARALRGRGPGLRRDREDLLLPVRRRRRRARTRPRSSTSSAGWPSWASARPSASVANVWDITPLEVIGSEVIPVAPSL